MIARVRGALLDRTPRERVLLVLAGVVAVGAGVHAAVWQPLAARREALLSAIAAHVAANRHLTQGGVLPIPLSETGPSSGSPLSARLADSAAALGLTVRRLDPAGDGAAEVTLEDAPFDLVMAWLIALERDQGHALRAFTIQRSPAPGVVAVTVSVGG